MILLFCLLLLVGFAFYRFPFELFKAFHRFILRFNGLQPKPFQSKNGTLYTYEGGTGQTMVLIHGFMVHAGNWADLVPKLSKKFRLVTFDLPGHGKSPKTTPFTLEQMGELIKDYLLSLSEKEPIILVGNSMGGGIALKFAIEHPERVQQLFLINSAGLEWEIDTSILLPRNFAEARRKMKYIVSPKLNPPKFILKAVLRDNIPNYQELAAEAIGNSKYYLDNDLNRLQHKPYIIWGKKDGLFNTTYLEKFLSFFPKYELLELEESAHVPHNTEAKRVATFIMSESSMRE
jgi:pimeloyl-ACP methyl ester carboxylesterase